MQGDNDLWPAFWAIKGQSPKIGQAVLRPLKVLIVRYRIYWYVSGYVSEFRFGYVSEVKTWVSQIRLGYFEFVKIIGKAMISVFTKEKIQALV